MEPLYQGEPILAVAAVDELTAAEAIEKIQIDFDPLPFVIDPLDTLGPVVPTPEPKETSGCPLRHPRRRQGLGRLRRPRSEFSNGPRAISLTTNRAVCPWERRPTNGRMATWMQVSKMPRWFSMKPLSRLTPATRRLETRSAMAYWQNGKVYVHTGTQSTAQTVPAIGRWLNIDPSQVVFISEYTGGGFGSKITGGVTLIIPALLVEESECAGDDAHQPRRGNIHRPCAAQYARAG